MTIRITNICAAASSCNLGCMRRQPRLHEKKEFNLFHLAILVFNLLLDSKVGKKIEIKKQKCVFMLNKVLKLVNVRNIQNSEKFLKIDDILLRKLIFLPNLLYYFVLSF